MVEELIPIVLFLTIGGVFVLAYYFRYRTRQDIQTTVRTAIERDAPLSPELIETLSRSIANPHADLRRGVVSLAIGLAFFLMAGLIGEEDAEGPLMAIAMFPILVGIAYLGLWFFVGRNQQPAARPGSIGTATGID